MIVEAADKKDRPVLCVGSRAASFPPAERMSEQCSDSRFVSSRNMRYVWGCGELSMWIKGDVG